MIKDFVESFMVNFVGSAIDSECVRCLSRFWGSRYFLGSLGLSAGIIVASHVGTAAYYFFNGGSGMVVVASSVIATSFSVFCVGLSIVDKYIDSYVSVAFASLVFLVSGWISYIVFALFMSLKIGGCVGVLMGLPPLFLIVEFFVSSCLPELDNKLNVDNSMSVAAGVSIFGLLSGLSGLFVCLYCMYCLFNMSPGTHMYSYSELWSLFVML